MSTCAPNFDKKFKPVDEILENAFTRARNQNKSALKSIAIHKISWGTEHTTAFTSIRGSLSNAEKIAFPDTDHKVGLNTDASESWGQAVILPTKDFDLGNAMERQQHEPLAFLGEKFPCAQRKCTTCRKEAYAIAQTFHKMDYVVWGAKSLHVLADYKFLFFCVCTNSPPTRLT